MKITAIFRILPMVIAIVLGLLIAYIDDFKYLSRVSFWGSVTCKGYAFGTNCEFCGLDYENCIPPDYEREWNCIRNSTHKYLGARCTYVCVGPTVKNPCAQETERCYHDKTSGNCDDIVLYQQEFHRGRPVARRRLQETQHTQDTQDDSALNRTPKVVSHFVPGGAATRWSIHHAHPGKCAVEHCGAEPCTWIILGSGLPDVIDTSGEHDVFIPEQNTLTCFCGHHHHHLLVVQNDTVVSSCGMDLHPIRQHKEPTAYKKKEVCNPTRHNGDCVCPWGHYMVGGFFCAKQFSPFVQDKIITL